MKRKKNILDYSLKKEHRDLRIQIEMMKETSAQWLISREHYNLNHSLRRKGITDIERYDCRIEKENLTLSCLVVHIQGIP